MFSKKQKIEWVDYSKGIGIICVVYCHSLGTLAHTKGFELNLFFYNILDTFAEGFQMPLFFFLSGIFIYPSIRKYSNSDFIYKKLRTIAYPYFLWSIIQIGVKSIFSIYCNNKVNFVETTLKIVYMPYMQFWYLHTLFLFMMIVFMLRSINKIYVFLIALIMCLVLQFQLIDLSILKNHPSLIINVHHLFKYFIYFMSGAILIGLISKLSLKRNSSSIVTLLFFLYIITVFLFMNKHEIEFYRTNLLIASLGIMFVITVSIVLQNGGYLIFIRKIGENSLIIYVAHFIFLIGSKVILLKLFQCSNVYIHFIINTLCAIMFPLIIMKISERVGFKYMIKI